MSVGCTTRCGHVGTVVVWIIGGGDLVGQFDDAGLLDRVILGMCPVTLGAGAPLLPRRITSERMRVTDVRLEAQQVRIVLDLERNGSPTANEP